MSISVKLCVHLSSSCIEKLSCGFLQLKTTRTQIKNLLLHLSNACKYNLNDRGLKTSTIMLFGTRYFFTVNLWLENYLNELAIFMELCPTLLFFQENSHIIYVVLLAFSFDNRPEVSSADFFQSNLSWTTMLTMSAQLCNFRQSC